MNDVFAIDDVPPIIHPRHPSAPPLSTPDLAEMENFYKFHYAEGLDQFFETHWYSTHGYSHLAHEPNVRHLVSQCIEQFKTRADARSSNKATVSLEASMVWHLACLPRSIPPSNASNDSTVHTLLSRIDTIEYLLTGQFLPSDRIPASPPPSIPSPANDHDPAYRRHKELSFWHQMGRLTSLRDDHPDDPTPRREIARTLDSLYGVLAMQEARDVIYSIAIVRHIGGRMPDFHPRRHLVAVSKDGRDDVGKLRTAHEFVDNEERAGNTQVVQRMCSMAIRGWVLQKR